MKRKKTKKGITGPAGFRASGICCGIRKSKPDLALIFTERPAVCSGLFTNNKIKAAPVQIAERRINNPVSAVIINSGNANAGTGRKGIEDCLDVCNSVSNSLDIPENSVIPASTGIIGEFLPVRKIIKAIPELKKKLSVLEGENAAKAILTTDTKIKVYNTTIRFKKSKISIGCMAKGAGMINLKLATMLLFITTDLRIKRSILNRIFKKVVKETLNKFTIDGETSTNDMALILANGMAENEPLSSSEIKKFMGVLKDILSNIVIQLARDGEGVTKIIRINVTGCNSHRAAEKVARSVANSILVKTAFFGENPNWGRILCAIGNSGVGIDKKKLDIKIGKVPVFSKNNPQIKNYRRLQTILKRKEIDLFINLNKGRFSDSIITTDLSKKYVELNSSYKT